MAFGKFLGLMMLACWAFFFFSIGLGWAERIGSMRLFLRFLFHYSLLFSLLYFWLKLGLVGLFIFYPSFSLLLSLFSRAWLGWGDLAWLGCSSSFLLFFLPLPFSSLLFFDLGWAYPFLPTTIILSPSPINITLGWLCYLIFYVFFWILLGLYLFLNWASA